MHKKQVLAIFDLAADPFVECLDYEENDIVPNVDEFREIETADRSDKSTEKSLSQE